MANFQNYIEYHKLLGLKAESLLVIPAWTTAGRPSGTDLEANLLGINTDITANSTIEWYDGTRWLHSLPETAISDYRKNNYQQANALGLTYRDENRQSITLATNESLIHGLVYAKDKLWAATTLAPSRILRFNNLDDLTDYTVSVIGGGYGSFLDIIYVPEKDKLYIAALKFGTDVEINEIDPVTLSFTPVATITGYTSIPQSLTTDGTYLYLLLGASSDPSSYVYKYNLSDWSLAASTTLTGKIFGHAIRYDGTNLYLTGADSPGWIAKMNPADLTYTLVTFAVGDNKPTDDLAFVGDYIWVGLEADNGYILKIKKSDLSITRINTGISASSSYGLFFDGSYIWNCIYTTTPGTILRINPETNEIYSFQLEAGETNPNEIVSDGQRLFITCYNNPAQIIRLSIPSLTYVSGQSGVNIYNSDGLLTGDRVLEINSHEFNIVSSAFQRLYITPTVTQIFSPDNTKSFQLTNSAVTLSGLTNTGNRLIGQLGENGNLGYLTVGTGLSLSAGVLSSTGISGITADNGLTASTSTNVQLGGALTKNTAITGGGFILEVDGNDFHNALQGINSSTGAGVYGQSSGGYGVYGNGATGVYGYSTTNEGGIFSSQPTTTNTIHAVLRLERFTSGTPANNMAGSLDMDLSTSVTGRIANQLIWKWVDATDATRTSQFIITGVNNAVTGDILTLNGNKSIQLNGYGSGTNTGTATYALQVDASGNIIEGSVSYGLATQIPYTNATADGFSYSSNLTFDGALNIGGNVLPLTSDGGALGSTTKMWSDLFLASGGIINWNNGDVTATHATGNLAIGGLNGVTVYVSQGAKNVGMQISSNDINTNSFLTMVDGASNGTISFGGVASANFAPAIKFTPNNATYPYAAFLTTTVDTGTVPAYLVDSRAAAGALATQPLFGVQSYAGTPALQVNADNTTWFNGGILPRTSDGAALGSTTKMWSDLFLASGGVINWNNGDVTLTHSANQLAFAGGNYSLDGTVILPTAPTTYSTGGYDVVVRNQTTGNIEEIGVLANYIDDTAAAAGGIAIGQYYRNGSVVMVRVS